MPKAKANVEIELEAKVDEPQIDEVVENIDEEPVVEEEQLPKFEAEALMFINHSGTLYVPGDLIILNDKKDFERLLMLNAIE